MSIKSGVNLYLVRYGIVILLLVSLVLPFYFALNQMSLGVYSRIFLCHALYIGGFLITGYVALAPTRKLFRKSFAVSKIDTKRMIFVYCLKIASALMICFLVYFYAPIFVGSFNFLVLKQPLERLSDTVTSLSSTHRGITSRSICLYSSCSITLQNHPNTIFNYLYAPNLQVGRKYEFLVFPNTGIIVGNK